MSVHPRRSALLPLLAGALLLPATTPLVAQSGPSVLSLLPSYDRVLTLNTPAEGAFVPGEEYVDPYGRLLQGWAFRAAPGANVTFDLISDDFDAYLYVVGEGGREVMEDDDSGGECHARILYRMGTSGEVLVVASGYSEDGALGHFTLHARTNPPPPLDEPCSRWGDWDFWDDEGSLPEELTAEGRTIAVGETVNGILGEERWSSGRGQPLQAWELELTQGQTVVIDLMSDDFDAYLYVTGTGMEAVAYDDDGGDGLNSRMVFTAPASGSYLVVASVFSSGEGRYTLRVAGVEGE